MSILRRVLRSAFRALRVLMIVGAAIGPAPPPPPPPRPAPIEARAQAGEEDDEEP
jgi:hypothetical protein